MTASGHVVAALLLAFLLVIAAGDKAVGVLRQISPLARPSA